MIRRLLAAARTSPEGAYRAALIGAFVIAALLRISATTQELPPYQFCDESIFSSEAERMVLNHQWVTQEFRSGGLNIYPMVLVGRILTHFGIFDSTTFVIIGRWLYAVVLASAAIFFVAGSARVLTRSRTLGVVAAVLFLLSPSLLAVSRYWYPDHYSVLFSAALVYLLMVLMVRRPAGRSRLLLIVAIGGVFGAALAVKYTFSVAALPIAIAFGYEALRSGERPLYRVRRFALELGLAAGTAALVALVLDFSAVIDPKRFHDGFVFNIQNYSRPGGGPEGIVFYAFLLFLASLGLIGLVGFAIGVIRIGKTHLPILIVLLSFPIVNIAYLGLQGLVFNRNIISSIPFLLPLVTVGVGSLLWGARARSARRVVAVIGVGVGAVLQLAQIGANVATDVAPDSEPIAAAWINTHVPKTALVGVNNSCSASPAQFAGMRVETDPTMAQRLPYYVINSYWESALNGAFRGPAATWSILDQKYLHYYYPSDRDLPSDVVTLPWPHVTPQQAAPAGYRVVKEFASNGPTIVVLRREN